MNVGYVVLAYKRPEQVGRLLRWIAGPHSAVAIHVDRSTDETIFRELRREAADHPDVQFVPRVRTHWGGFGLVKATLRCMEHLVRTSNVDYVLLLTGQDYPVRSPAAIRGTLAEANGRSFLHHSPIPYAAWGPEGGVNRLENWYHVGRRRFHFRPPWRRATPGGLQPYGGEAYWCLARPAAEHVLRFTGQNRAFMRFFEHVFIPDEIFFHTIVANSPFRDALVNDTLHFVDWEADPAPAILTSAHYERIVRSGKLFARKFDLTVDERVLDMLDERIARDA